MKLTAAEIEQHFKDNEPEETVLEFVEAELDEVIEEPYDSRQDDWLFEDDYYHYEESAMYDHYDDPFHDDFYD